MIDDNKNPSYFEKEDESSRLKETLEIANEKISRVLNLGQLLKIENDYLRKSQATRSNLSRSSKLPKEKINYYVQTSPNQAVAETCHIFHTPVEPMGIIGNALLFEPL